ncbi:CDP-diacylglycerol--inositol 3-phosphatidyltransferase [Centruroides vittatus]|uniref:CDP-diacylglycerol--inositol 3-phosphatidyltransferase-like n=1 Tax=Centruroides sculpturatus TaxID=218467 RepID=UPI000C6CA1D3|nr:CDP-diacylglycerol--inositol 3-phosphatidyltransferase-like [Centruroides sculpturatus]
MAENIFLFVPNLIGYARIILAFISFYYMPFDHVKASFCYLLSGLLDAFDGYAARWLNQATKFGAILDQLTDRCATMCLLVALSYFYPSYMFLFQLSMTIDIASHWIHLQTSLMQGKTNHKFIDSAENPVMKIYYTSRPILFTMCAGNELFYCMLYLLHFTEGPTILGLGLFRLITIISAPVSFVKTLISLLQMIIACMNLGIIDTKERSKQAEKEK